MGIAGPQTSTRRRFLVFLEGLWLAHRRTAPPAPSPTDRVHRRYPLLPLDCFGGGAPLPPLRLGFRLNRGEEEDGESYNQHMTEKYAREEEQLQLDPEVWVAASGALKKGHVYGFGHSIDTSRVLSGASSSASQTSVFSTAAGALGTSPNEMMGFIADTISGLESHLAQMMETCLVQMQTQVSDAVQAQLSQALSLAISHALSQVSIPPQAAPSTSAQAPHVKCRVAVAIDGRGVDANLRILQVIGSPESRFFTWFSFSLASASCPRVPKASNREKLCDFGGLAPFFSPPRSPPPLPRFFVPVPAFGSASVLLGWSLPPPRRSCQGPNSVEDDSSGSVICWFSAPKASSGGVEAFTPAPLRLCLRPQLMSPPPSPDVMPLSLPSGGTFCCLLRRRRFCLRRFKAPPSSEDPFQSARWFDWRVDRVHRSPMESSSASSPNMHLWRLLLCLALISTALLYVSVGVSVQPPIKLSLGIRVQGSGSPCREAFGDDLCLLTTLCATMFLFQYLGFTSCVRTSGPSAYHGRCHALSALVGSSWYGAKHGSLSTLEGFFHRMYWMYWFLCE
ncbi:hypothetical protein Taro_038393 [Colocasia esculenta]|uniref:Uncharacterized protein n=1 Tax=Colocasia esculenta TaxID=4460 RepID=A0A843WCN7_COLES|nr:hypothetical protein [Colocasia esculenta]